MTYSGPERRRSDRSRAALLGAWLLDRAALAAALIFFTYVVLGIVAWGVTQTNQRTKTSLRNVEQVLQNNQRLIEDIERTQKLIEDCTTPNHPCFEEQLASDAVRDAFAALRNDLVATFGCALYLEPSARTPANLEACGIPPPKEATR